MNDDALIVSAGSHLYAQCPECHNFVRLTGWFARWHLCVTTEARAQRLRAAEAVARQQAAGELSLEEYVNRATARTWRSGAAVRSGNEDA